MHAFICKRQQFHKTKDVIVLQDPDDAELCRLRDINNFAHIASSRGGAGLASSGDVRHSVTATRIMEKIKRKREEEAEVEEKKKRQIFIILGLEVELLDGLVAVHVGLVPGGDSAGWPPPWSDR